MKIATVAEAIETFKNMVTGDALAEEAITARHDELMKLNKEELTQMIISYEKRKTNGGVKVQDVAKAILTDPEFITLSNGEVAEVVRTLIPGSNTSHKSIAGYVSKKREEWDLPARITIRRAR